MENVAFTFVPANGRSSATTNPESVSQVSNAACKARSSVARKLICSKPLTGERSPEVRMVTEGLLVSVVGRPELKNGFTSSARADAYESPQKLNGYSFGYIAPRMPRKPKPITLPLKFSSFR